jgi:hypothetical protein
VLLDILIHAAFNTMPLTIVLMYEGSPADVLSNRLLRGIVIVVKRRSSSQA